jgi:hypothetical protein
MLQDFYGIIFVMQQICSIVLGTRIMEDQPTSEKKMEEQVSNLTLIRTFSRQATVPYIPITSSYHMSIDFGKLSILDS